MSVRKAAENGNMVIFGVNIDAIRKLAKLDKIEENVIVSHKTGIRSMIHDKNGMYVYPMAIRRKKKKARGDPMELDVLGNGNDPKCEICVANEWGLF